MPQIKLVLFRPSKWREIFDSTITIIQSYILYIILLFYKIYARQFLDFITSRSRTSVYGYNNTSYKAVTGGNPSLKQPDPG